MISSSDCQHQIKKRIKIKICSSLKSKFDLYPFKAKFDRS